MKRDLFCRLKMKSAEEGILNYSLAVLFGLDVHMDSPLHIVLHHNNDEEEDENIRICLYSHLPFAIYIENDLLYVTGMEYDPTTATRRSIFGGKTLTADILDSAIQVKAIDAQEKYQEVLKERVMVYKMQLAVTNACDYTTSWILNLKFRPEFGCIALSGKCSLHLSKEIISTKSLNLILTGSCSLILPQDLSLIDKCKCDLFGNDETHLLPRLDFSGCKMNVGTFHAIGSSTIFNFLIRKKIQTNFEWTETKLVKKGLIKGFVKKQKVLDKYISSFKELGFISLEVKPNKKSNCKKPLKMKKSSLKKNNNQNQPKEGAIIIMNPPKKIILSAIANGQLLVDKDSNMLVITDFDDKNIDEKSQKFEFPGDFSCSLLNCRDLYKSYNQYFTDEYSLRRITHCDTKDCHLFVFQSKIQICEECNHQICTSCYQKTLVPKIFYEEMDYEYKSCPDCRLKEVLLLQDKISEIRESNAKYLLEEIQRLKTKHNEKKKSLKQYEYHINLFRLSLQAPIAASTIISSSSSSSSSAASASTSTKVSAQNTSHTSLPQLLSLRSNVQANGNGSKWWAKNTRQSKSKTQPKLLTRTETTTGKISEASYNNT